MSGITQYVKEELMRLGADLSGFGDLTCLPAETRLNMPVGISVAVKYPKEIIRGITDLPTAEYYEHYILLNKKLDMIVSAVADGLISHGYQAFARTTEIATAEYSEKNFFNTLLPHKTVATHAGIGWIGKCALLITPQFGSMVRISAILTDAPLETATPINESQCGDCEVCTKACPAGAVLGKSWSAGITRDEFYDALLCRDEARKRSLAGFGQDKTVCGKCIVVCPYTRRYLNGGDGE